MHAAPSVPSETDFILLSWNVNGIPRLDYAPLFAHISQHSDWHCVCFQEPLKCANLSSFPLTDPPQDSVSTALDSSSQDSGNPTLADPCMNETSHVTAEGHVIFQNLSDFSASVVLRSAVTRSIRWQKSCCFAVAVVVGMILIISAYLPQPSLGIELYAEALNSVRGLAEAAPKVRHTLIACDANSHLRYHEELNHIVDPLTMSATRHQAHPKNPDFSDPGPPNGNPAPARPVSTARRHGSFPREQLLTEFALDLQVRAANTFPAQHQLPLQPQVLPESDAIWTHCWYRNGRIGTRIDFVFSSLNTSSSAFVYYGIDCNSDHKLLISMFRVPSDDLQPGKGLLRGDCSALLAVPTSARLPSVTLHTVLTLRKFIF